MIVWLAAFLSLGSESLYLGQVKENGGFGQRLPGETWELTPRAFGNITKRMSLASVLTGLFRQLAA